MRLTGKQAKDMAEKLGVPMPKGKHKYSAEQTTVDGIKFSSKKEAKRYSELMLLQEAGEISDLTLQPRYPLRVRGIKIGEYVADFRYRDKASFLVVEDVKGFKTPLYKWKKRHFEAQYGVKITEI